MREAGFFFGDAADAETTGELGFDMGKRNVAVGEEDEGVEEKVGDFLDQVVEPCRPWLSGGFDDLGGFFEDLRADLGKPGLEKGRDIGAFGGGVRLSVGDDGVEGVENRGRMHEGRLRIEAGFFRVPA